jgi:pyruvate formate lyase activating enzyme
MHAAGLKNVIVSNGFCNEAPLRELLPFLDAANIDLKAFTQQFYHKLCFANLEPVLDTLRWLKQETDVWIEVTTLLIPGHNDSEAEIDQLCDWFAANLGPETPLHFTAFHPDFKMQDIPRTPAQTLSRARQQALAAGLRHVYTGNVYDKSGQSTYCAGCGKQLIERNWYNLGEWNLTAEGNCRFCGTALAGHFAAEAGTWGSRRQAINIR